VIFATSNLRNVISFNGILKIIAINVGKIVVKKKLMLVGK